jgi:hypothetical protein
LIAGSNVWAASIGSSTAIDAAIAAAESTLTPTMSMPQRAMQTVIPANSTARPAVAEALTTASCVERPRRSPVRVRVRMNRE